MLPIRHRIYRFGTHSRAPVAGHALHAQATMTIKLRIDALFVDRDGIGQFPAGKIERAVLCLLIFHQIAKHLGIQGEEGTGRLQKR